MQLIRKVPVVSLQKAVFSLLKNGQDKAVYGNVPPSVHFPYITIDAVTAKPLYAKNVAQWDCSVTINIWGTEDGKGDIYETIEDISYLVSKYGTAVSVDGFAVLGVNIDMIETFPAESAGYHGTITLLYQLSDEEEK